MRGAPRRPAGGCCLGRPCQRARAGAAGCIHRRPGACSAVVVCTWVCACVTVRRPPPRPAAPRPSCLDQHVLTVGAGAELPAVSRLPRHCPTGGRAAVPAPCGAVGQMSSASGLSSPLSTCARRENEPTNGKRLGTLDARLTARRNGTTTAGQGARRLSAFLPRSAAAAAAVSETVARAWVRRVSHLTDPTVRPVAASNCTTVPSSCAMTKSAVPSGDSCG